MRMFRKFYLRSAIIEVTRRCNLQCSHCLRGDAEDKDMPNEVMERFLDNVSFIDSLVFTGGEPTLATDRIRDFFEIMKARDIGMGGFYIATNGAVINSAFISLVAEMVFYSEGKLETCAINYSNSPFHEEADRQAIEMLGLLKIVSNKYTYKGRNQGYRGQDAETSFGEHITDDRNMLSIGRGIDCYDSSHLSIDYPQTLIVPQDEGGDIDCEGEELYLTCEGDLFPCCNLSYNIMEDKNPLLWIGNILSAYQEYYGSGTSVDTSAGPLELLFSEYLKRIKTAGKFISSINENSSDGDYYTYQDLVLNDEEETGEEKGE